MAKSQNKTVSGKVGKSKVVRYNKWGYIFLIPFAVVFVVFTLIPLVTTFYNSFFEHYWKLGLTEIGPNFVGLDNFKTLFESDFLKYAGNTAIMWIMGFIPQIIVSLLLAQWFSDTRLNLK